ncbi:MAG TPA: hypothetical protein VGE63_02155 [Candidatus Paceibacterota bacterium]
MKKILFVCLLIVIGVEVYCIIILNKRHKASMQRQAARIREKRKMDSLKVANPNEYWRVWSEQLDKDIAELDAELKKQDDEILKEASEP